MAELTTLHATDIEDRPDKLEVIAKFVEQNDVDAVTLTGDFIDMAPHNEAGYSSAGSSIVQLLYGTLENHSEFKEFQQKANEAIQGIVQKYGESNVRVDQISHMDMQQIQQIQQQVQQVANKVVQETSMKGLDKIKPDILKTVETQYETIDAVIGEIAKHAKVLGVVGNHDTIHAYDKLTNVTFVDKLPKYELTGKTGTTFIVQGDPNTWEVPPITNMFPAIGITIQDHTINLDSGKSTRDLDERIAKALEKEDPQGYGLKTAQNLHHAKKNQDRINTYHAREAERLGEIVNADIYLTHKLPDCHKVRDVYGEISGDTTLKYSANAIAIMGGHFDDGQIGNSRLAELMAQEVDASNDDIEIENINGEDVVVEYVDATELRQMNPGKNHFFVTEYNTDKSIKEVRIYEFTREAA